MNRRSFFQLVAGAVGALALPFKAKAQDPLAWTCQHCGHLVPSANGFASGHSCPQGRAWYDENMAMVSLEDWYVSDGSGMHVVTLLTRKGDERPFWAEFEDRGKDCPFPTCTRRVAFDLRMDVVLQRYPHIKPRLAEVLELAALPNSVFRFRMLSTMNQTPSYSA